MWYTSQQLFVSLHHGAETLGRGSLEGTVTMNCGNRLQRRDYKPFVATEPSDNQVCNPEYPVGRDCRTYVCYFFSISLSGTE